MSNLQEFLSTHGFTKLQSSSGKAFGDSENVFKKGELQIRIVRDRGQTFVDIRKSESESWFDLPLILGLIGAKEKDILAVDEAEEILGSYLPQIESVALELTKERIEAMRESRLKRRMPGLMK